MGETILKVLDIQRLSTEDGPGLRTTVFVKGCPLKCAWCHNPESIHPQEQMIWLENRCIGCRLCVNACPNRAISLDENGQNRDMSLCTGCQSCADVCPTLSVEVKGKDWDVDELVAELLKDRAYFEKSGGGITVSGGDPMMQWEKAAVLFRKLKEAGISTALDSALLTTQKALDAVLPYVDLILMDIKLIDEAEHKKWTGVSNVTILENIRYIARQKRAGNIHTNIWIRTPIIPGATDTEANISGISRFISENLQGLFERWEMCAFNNLCRDKYRRLGIQWQFAQTPLMKRGEMEAVHAIARRSNSEPEKVFWTGATAVESD